MKTAEEWCNSLNGDHATDAYVTENDIKQIQLDAVKEGMRRAAEVPTDCQKSNFDSVNINIAYGAELKKKAILTAAEQLTISDL